MVTNRILAVFLMFATIGLLPTGAMAVDEPAKKVALGLDWFANPNHGPLIVALERGFFADAGLDVSLVPPTGTRDNVAMVLDGRVDIGMADQVRVQIEIAEDTPLTVVGTLIPVPLNIVLAVDGGPIRSIGDLRGKRVGYADSAVVQRGLLQVALAAHGVDIKDITLVDVGFTMVEAMLSGKVDALTDAYRNFEPFQVSLAGKTPEVFDIEDGTIPNYSELVYIADRRKLNADTIGRFHIAVERAVRAIAYDPDATFADFIKYDTKLDTELNKRAWVATAPLLALRPALLDPASYDRFASFLKEHKFIASIPPSKDYLFNGRE